MLTVQNSLKDRSKALRRVEGTENYQWGWDVRNRRKKCMGYFNCVGEGSMDEALAWMAQSDERVHKPRAYTEFKGY